MSEINPTVSTNDSSEAAVKKSEKHSDEPDLKRPKLCTEKEQSCVIEKLEHRLGGILCCAVCLDLPKSAIYQCTNGHLMCAGCFNHLLADARLRDETATCPGCRIEISKTAASRNLAVEKAVGELPLECQFCSKEYPRNFVERHETLCDDRTTKCQYSRIGCPWRGPHREHMEHERVCIHPHNTGAQILSALDFIDTGRKEEKMLYDSLFELLSCEKIMFHDVQLKAYRTDDFIQKLYYETPTRINAFNQQWSVKARINTNNQKDPTLSCEREMTYQVILKTKTSVPLNMHYMVLRGPFSDIKVGPKIYKFEFLEEANETPFQKLPLTDIAECNRLLAAKVINFRLVLFLLSK